jgi:CRISPR-associated protein (TIGR02710 family)
LSKVGLIITAGTTPHPLIKSIEELNKEFSGNLSVYIIYGRPFKGQKPDPLENANKVKNKAKELGLEVLTAEVSDPEDFDEALKVSIEIVNNAINENERIICNYTGGTKVLSSALVYVALTKTQELKTVELYYVGGEKRDETGRVLTPAMIIRRKVNTYLNELIRRALEYVKKFQYINAYNLLVGLNSKGKAYYIMKCLEALYYWDNFKYEESHNILRELKAFSESNIEDEEIGFLCKIISKLSKISKEISYYVSQLIKAENNDVNAIKSISNNKRSFILAIDVLENARRKLINKNYNESILRCYRAIEVAIQLSLIIKYGLNPWHPNWNNLSKLEKVKNFYKEKLPEEISLFNGLKILEILEGKSLEIDNEIKTIAYCRNHSMLEHGYQSFDEETARKVIEYTQHIISKIEREIFQFSDEEILNFNNMVEHKF